MFIAMVVVFILGYTAIALEHPLKIDKAASALLIGVLLWVIYIMGADGIVPKLDSFWVFLHENGFMSSMTIPEFEEMLRTTNNLKLLEKPELQTFLDSMHNYKDVGIAAAYTDYISHHQVLSHLGEIAEILFFLLGAMTIVEIVDQHQGFKLITDKLQTTNKVKLLWILSFLTFFMSAALDNLTTTIVLVALLRKLIADKQTRWFFASMVVLAANAGGAWSPIGDVTTIMLWIGGQITAGNIISMVILPSLVTMIVPLVILSFTMKGNVKRPVIDYANQDGTVNTKQSQLILFLGVASLLFVPVFKTVTHLPPYMGMLLGLGNLWVITEILHRGRRKHTNIDATGEVGSNPINPNKLTVIKILTKVDVPTVFFFLGILSAVAALQSAGHLRILAGTLDVAMHNIFAIDLVIGVLSSIVDNVPLVAGAMGMYDIMTPEMISAAADPAYAKHFMQDGLFWEFLAYCAGTGGSILIIGSAAGVAAMGMEKIDFIWYMKKISLLALVGYLAGAGAYYLQAMLLHG